MVALAVGVAGSVIRVPYDTLSPGGTLALEHRVSVRGVKAETDRGEVMLLFVRLRSHIDLWRWLQAKLDPDIDLVKQVNVTGGHTQKFSDRQDICDMAQSQISARVAALTAVGYHVPVVGGLERDRSARDLLHEGPRWEAGEHEFPRGQGAPTVRRNRGRRRSRAEAAR